MSISKNVNSENDCIVKSTQSTARTTNTTSLPSSLPDLPHQSWHLSWAPFNNSNPFQSSWCPDATCQNSPLCTPCNRRHLFILSTARSGSTTLLRMMNELPNTRISGENHNTFGIFSQIESNLWKNRPRLLMHPMDKPDGPFRHNTIPKGSLGCISQQLHYTMNPPPLHIQQDIAYAMHDLKSTYDADRILGFKSVRLHLFKSPDDAVTYFKTNFPCSRFIINIQQNITHQYESYLKNFVGTKNKLKKDEKQKQKEKQREELEHLVNMENQINGDNLLSNSKYKGPDMHELESIRDFHIQLGELFGTTYAKVIKLEDWEDNVDVLNEVIHWLGFDPQTCAFNTITHDNANGYSVDNSIVDVGENCKLL